MTAQIEQVNTQLLSQPPPSIIVSRSEAFRYVESCELAEMMPSSNSNNNFLNQILSSSSSSSNNANNNGGDGQNNNSSSSSVNKYSSIIQMAFLLYLGEYVHARHLWRRQRNNNNFSSSDEYNQLSMFWNAAKYCYLWNTGGVSSSLSSGDDESSNLPYSTLMLRALQSNAESSLEPLATYSKELVSIFRYRVNNRLHSSFDDIREDELMLRMNLNDDESGTEDVLGRYGWKRAAADSTHLVPNQEWKPPVDIGRGKDGVMSTDDDRIHQLSEVVMFLEQTKMNA
mmetsp:Transcript_852/g.1150  ORF Transcript_852/g.1150 Transcript_852/m.1150 type:complete len:285 (+) Transcript_852:57-911(+)|eukprot:CAMPEP_0201687442 /NCGR_PEP_ID=MMETSP0578-20130828/1507_1 /ASSEMBLY_ACC=CAM_ASM_000663 /TAXON_ID=267565 /ORGANISM="Skeletonema grethea, Strain CCMP 1804" /LENGTH=284 /DNA_ID=CAMNT_0048171601 /DNA_START=45 /DNA_END=899 /DNA_ORIENTATION=-